MEKSKFSVPTQVNTSPSPNVSSEENTKPSITQTEVLHNAVMQSDVSYISSGDLSVNCVEGT